MKVKFGRYIHRVQGEHGPLTPSRSATVIAYTLGLLGLLIILPCSVREYVFFVFFRFQKKMTFYVFLK